MKVLVVLRGCPGCGKSTFVKNNKLEKFTVSSDLTRLRLGTLTVDDNGKQTISQKYNKQVWEKLYIDLENKMKREKLAVVDATHCTFKSFSKYDKLAKKYNYQIIVIDFEVALNILYK